MKFGNLITYTGKYLSKATAKAANGNLVFAHITGSATATGADKDQDGYYIYAGGAEALLVTKEDFNALKADVIALSTKVGDLTFDGTTYTDVPAYVTARLTAANAAALEAAKTEMTNRGLVEGSVLGTAAYADTAAGVTADEQGLATGAQVHAHVSGAVATLENRISGVVGSLEDYVFKTSVKDSFDDAADGDVASVGAVKSYVSGIIGSELGDAAYKGVATTIRGTEEASDDSLATEKAVRDAISTLGTVMDFKGVVEGESLPAVDGYAAGDVIIWNSEEYVLGTDNAWHEIGQVKADEAVLTLTSGNEAHLIFDKASGAVTATIVTAEVAKDATGVAVAGDVYAKIEAAKSELLSGAINTNAEAISAHVGAATDAHAASAISVATIEGKEDTVDNVQAALADLYAADKVASEGLNDLNERLDDLSGVVGAISVTGDAASHSVVEGTAADGYVVKNTLAVAATGTEGTEDYVPATAGLVTDSYLDDRLAWEVLAD